MSTTAMVPEPREEHQYLSTSPQGDPILCILSQPLLLPCCVTVTRRVSFSLVLNLEDK